MKLDVLSPEKLWLSAEVSMVTLPGKLGRFTILENHASLISMLDAGVLIYRQNEQELQLRIGAGFVEVKDNQVVVCIEQINND